MRDAFHEELEAITDSLVEMTKLVASRWHGPRPRCSTRDLQLPRA